MDHAVRFGAGLYMYNPDRKKYVDTLMPTLGYGDAERTEARFLGFHTHVEEGIEVIHTLCARHGIKTSEVKKPELPDAPSEEEGTKQRNIVLLNNFFTFAAIEMKQEKIPGLKFTALMSDVLTSSAFVHTPRTDVLATSGQFKWGQDDTESFWWQMRLTGTLPVVLLV